MPHSIIVITGKLLSPVHTEGKGITKGHKYQKAVITGDIPRGCLVQLYIQSKKVLLHDKMTIINFL